MTTRGKTDRAKAGHQEIQGETIAKFEFFDNGFNPYSRYLDVDKIDLILRKREGDKVDYKEIQVKYGRLYEEGSKWQTDMFDYNSWKFMKSGEFSDYEDLYIAYVLSPTTGYQGDIFIFPAKDFNDLIEQTDVQKTAKGDSHKILFSRARHDGHWYLRKRASKFTEFNEDSVIPIQRYRRAFHLLN